MADKPLNQQYHEAVEALKAKGMSNADAIRQVAAELGKKENAIRGGIHQYKSRLAGGAKATTSRVRKAVPTVDDYLAGARQQIEAALALIDMEVADAKRALDAAQARYDDAVASVKDRKADLEKKLEAFA